MINKETPPSDMLFVIDGKKVVYAGNNMPKWVENLKILSAKQFVKWRKTQHGHAYSGISKKA